MAYKLQLKRGLLASLPNGSVGEPLFTTDTFDLYVGKGDGSNIKLQKFIASGSSSQFLKGDGSLDSTTYQGVLSGTGIVKSTGGTISYLTDNTANWDAAYNDKINSASVSGTTTKTLTLTQQDGGTITASWSDYDTAPVTSVFGRTGNVVATSGDYTTSLVTEGTNLYYTDARARAAITLTTTGSSGASTYVGGTLNIPTYTLAGLGGVASSRQLNINGTSYDLSADRSWSVGTVTSVDMSVPTGFAISGNPITSSGTLALAFATGYSLPTNSSQTNWDAAYNDKINSASVTGTTTKTLTLTQQDGGTITASWTDDNTDAVTSVFGRTGAVVAASGDYTTTQVTEGTNLYYTDARSRAALSFVAGSGAYNSTTGVITIPTNTNQLTNGASFITLASLSGGAGISYNNTTGVIASTITQYTDAMARASISGGTGISYNSTTGVITNTITQYTDAMARASLSFSAGSGAYNSTTGVITIPTNTNQLTNGAAFITLGSLSASAPLSYNNATGAFTISQASSTTNGFLSSTDWNTFNNKQNALTNPVTGTGTTNYVTKWTSSSAVGNSQIFDDGSSVGIGTTSFGGAKLAIQGGSILVRTDGDILKVNDVADSTYWFRFTRNGSNLEISNRQAGALAFLTSDIERLRITSSGSVGIGTTSPSVRFEVNNTINTTYSSSNTLAGGVISYIKNTSTTNSTDATIRLEATGAGNLAATSISAVHTGTGSSALTFGTRLNSGDVTERMRIDSSGNLGLGVTPTSGVGDVKHFEIESGGRFVAAGNNAEVGANYYYDSAYKYITSNAVTRFEMNGGAFRFYTAPSGTAGNAISFTQAMTLFSTGNLAVGGTSDAGYRLYVNGSAGFFNNGLRLGTAYSAIDVATGASGLYLSGSQGALNHMFINPSGNVGIGTTSPSGKLDVQGGYSYFDGLRLRGSDNAATIWKDSGDMGIYPQSGKLYLGSQGTQNVITVTSSSVGIGTTSPSSTLHINSSGTTNMYIQSAAGNGAVIRYYVGTTEAATARVDASSNYYIETANSERFRITSGGNVGIGTTSPVSLLDVNGAINTSTGFVLNNPTTGSAGLTIQYQGTTYAYARAAAGSGEFRYYIGPSAGWGGYHTFYTDNSERMRITSGGNLLVGSTSDNGSMLQVTGAATFSSSVTASGGASGVGFIMTNTTNSRQVTIGYTSGEAYNYIQAYDGTNFQRLVLNGSLSLAGSGAATFSSSVTTGGTVTIGGASRLSSITGNGLNFAIDGADKMFINTSGNVGIGTTSPDRKLYVVDTSNTQSTFLAYNQGATFTGNVIEAITDRTSSSAFNLMNLKSSTTTMFLVRGDGNVGIGTTNPTEKLHVNGNIKTAAPTGYTAGSWKLGTANTGTVTANRYITIEIDGQIYTINALLGTP